MRGLRVVWDCIKVYCTREMDRPVSSDGRNLYSTHH